MTVYSASKLKLELGEQLSELLTARANYNAAFNSLASLGYRIPVQRVDLRCSAYTVIKAYFKALEDKISKEHSGNTPAKLEIDDSFFSLSDLPYLDDMFINQDNKSRFKTKDFRCALEKACDMPIKHQQIIINELLDQFPFNEISKQIEDEANALVDKGLEIMSTQLVEDLCLNTVSYAPVIKQRYIACKMKTQDKTSYGFKERMARITRTLEMIQMQTDILFGDAIYELVKAIDSLGYGQERIESRTVLAKGSPLSICCYKEIYEFRFTHQAFEQISAFIMLNGTEKHQNTIFNITNQADQAA